MHPGFVGRIRVPYFIVSCVVSVTFIDCLVPNILALSEPDECYSRNVLNLIAILFFLLHVSLNSILALLPSLYSLTFLYMATIFRK